MSGLHHIMLLPSDLPFNELREIAHRQVRANKLQAGLAFGPRLCLYVYTNGTQCWSETVPRGAPAVTGGLRPCRDFPETPDMAERRPRLAGFLRANNPGGYLLGDLTKGGRPATFEESVLLAGLQENGVPRGLTRCLVCGEWQGRCLDPSPEFAGMVVQLDCPCANDNLCARCGRPLADRKLHSNYYDQATGTIWHIPSFCGLSHKCRA